ncbi:hypothetical protein ACFYPZ_38400 [Streptomyces sp. NPDC005506]|uniref:hypothetical protein n=1 Tax=unclassified Streptomyces TaxID=2593676 RepID=UPI0036973FD2
MWTGKGLPAVDRGIEGVLRLEKLLFLAIADVAVLSVNVGIEIVRVDVQCTTTGATCPGCGPWSTQVHSSYLRFPAEVTSLLAPGDSRR